SATIFGQVVPEEQSPKLVRQVAQKVHHSLARQLCQLQPLLVLLVPSWLRPLPGTRARQQQQQPLLPSLAHAPSSSLRTRIMSSITAMHFFTLALLCFILLGVHYGDAFNEEYGVQLSFCPQECDCQGLTIDCARRGLAYLPKPLPEDVRRLNLEGNNLTALHRVDFQRLSYLKLLQLMDNQIASIEPGVFDDLKSLERM
ncbi:hypothetical protein TYRP_010874, partial [Tyrophagus putrescentiae]